MKICLWFCSLFCVSAFAASLPYSDVSDLVRSGRVVFMSQPTTGEYRLVLSSIKKVNNQWRAKEQIIPRALVSRMTLELEERTSYTEARRHLQKDIAGAAEFTSLFECSGLDCGSSNGWANEFLRVKQLYGMDSNQFYSVLQSRASGQRETFVVWYLVQRGNGRIYLQQDVVRAGADMALPSSDNWLQRLESQGYFVVPDLDLEGAEPQIAESSIDLLLSLIQRQPDGVLRLVGHDYGPGSWEERERRSLFYAQWLRDRLVERGAASARLATHGLAHLAPAGRTRTARVEVVRD